MLQQNLSAAMRVIRTNRSQSIAEFSEDLGIARSSMQEILNGTGNPRMDTVEYIAEQLQVDPLTLLSGAFAEDQLQMALQLIQILDVVSHMSHSRRQEFGRLFQQLLNLMDVEDTSELEE